MVVAIFVGLAASPLFLSAETIRAELVARIEAATGRTVRIDGPVSFSVMPTARLSANGIGIAGMAGDAEAFSVESVSFGLSLLPLLTGTIEIYGVTITRPSILVETDAGGSNWTRADDNGATPTSIEDVITSQQAGQPQGRSAAGDAMAALDRLSIGRVAIADGILIWRDLLSGRQQRVEEIDLDIRLPRLDRAGTAEGSFTWHGAKRSLDLEIGERPDPTRFESIPAALTLSSDGGTIVAQGTALAGEALFSGTIEANGESLVDFTRGLGVELPDLPAFGAFDAVARIEAGADRISIDDYVVDLGGLAARGGAAIGLDRTRPGIGLKIDADRIDSKLFVAGSGSATAPAGGTTAPGVAGDGAIDFSPLRLVDVNVDISVKEFLVGAVPVTNFGMGIQVIDGKLAADIRSATINGAPGSAALVVETSGAVPEISGTVKMNGLDAAGLTALAGLDLPIEAGAVGLDVAFATRGAVRTALIENLEGKGRISLVNGRITDLRLAGLVADPAADKIEDVDLVAEFSSLDGPIEAKGGLSWRGEHFTVAARGDPRALGAGKTTAVAVSAASQRVDFGFSGDASLSGLGAGTVSLSTPSLRNLLAWVGRPIAPGGGLGPFSFEGAVSLSEASVAFDRARFSLDGSSGIATGKMAFGRTPQVSAGLSMTRLDVTPYLRASGAAGPAGGGAGTAAAGAGGGWSSGRIGFDGLRAIDANFNLKADEIVADQIAIGPSILTATIAGGRLSAELTEMALYSGIGVGMLSIDGSTATPSIEAFFRLDGIDALPFLRDAAGFSRIQGTASLSFDIRTEGDSEAALMAGLGGKGAVDFRDGAIRGIDIPRMVHSLSIETLLGWQQTEDQKTDFSELSGTYTIDRGILTNNDLKMVGPLLQVTGAGTVDIPNRSLAYRVNPSVAASQDASADGVAFAVPIRVEGPWSRPRIYPEIEGILQDPQGALERLRQLGGGLLGGMGTSRGHPSATVGTGVEGLGGPLKGLESLIGGSDGGAASQPAAPQPAGEPSPVVAAPPAAEALPGETPPAGDQGEAAPSNPPPPPDLAEPLDQSATAAQPDAAPADLPPPAPPTEGEPSPDAAPPPADPAADLLKSLFGQ